MNKHEEMVLYSSNEAAKYVGNISGWVDRNGMFFGDNESAARYSGCTHRTCGNCDQTTIKHWLICESCRSKKDFEKYLSMPKKEWDGVGMLYSDTQDQYFSDLDEIYDWMECSNVATIEELRLIICEPNYLMQIEEDHWADDLPEDGELPESVRIALEEFNKVIREAPAVSWSPGKYAAIVIGRLS